MSDRVPTPRTRLRRLPERAAYDRLTVDAILDEALLCHVGFVDPAGGFPVVQPMIHARLGDVLYLHGSSGSRQLRALASGAEVCVNATLVDGLVLARSGFHHSMNYRAVIVFGRTREVSEPGEVAAALDAITNHVSPGRAPLLRPPNRRELAATSVVALALEEASAKVRTGGPNDEEEDLDWPVWAGVVPVDLRYGSPVPETGLPAGVRPPATR